MSTMTPGLRWALIAGGIVVVLGGGGVAAVWAAGQIIPEYVVSATPRYGIACLPVARGYFPATPSPGKGRPFPVTSSRVGRPGDPW